MTSTNIIIIIKKIINILKYGSGDLIIFLIDFIDSALFLARARLGLIALLALLVDLSGDLGAASAINK
jgi:hypothetical protein